jgi:hypothetical protein
VGREGQARQGRARQKEGDLSEEKRCMEGGLSREMFYQCSTCAM